jgi:hypothetical protein
MRAVVVAVLAAGCGRYGFQIDAPAGDAIADADTSGLVAWLPMDSLANDTTPDATGHGHDGACSSVDSTCPVTVAGKISTALRFDGVNDHLSIADAPDLQPSTAFTVAVWVWIDAVPAPDYGCFANKVIGTGTNDSWQMCVTTSDQLYFGTDVTATDLGDALYTSQTFPINSWHHVAIAWDGTFKSLWFDGVEQARDQAALGYDGNPVLLGYDLDNGTPKAAFAGILDDLRIYNRVLSSSELATLAGI